MVTVSEMQQVTGTEGVAVDVEAYEGSESGALELDGSHWISMAAANVLPKVITTRTISSTLAVCCMLTYPRSKTHGTSGAVR